MSLSASPYMEWSKTRVRPAIDLAGSNLLPCALKDLPGAREELEISGESPEGWPPLLEAIARRYGVAPEGVATAGGCSGANFLACAALLETGDDVLAETPGYDPMAAAARMLGASIATFPRRPENGYDVDSADLRAALSPRTRLVLLSNPHNPTGALVSAGALSEIARLAEERGFHVLVDEVYRDTVLTERPASAATISPRVLVSDSLTKAYGLASLRCGWVVGAPETIRRVRRARDVVDVWAAMPADRLSVLAFRHLDRLAARARAIIAENAESLRRWLSGRDDVDCVFPRATIAFPRWTGSADAGPFCERLLRETGTAVAPGRFFGAPAHFRIAFGGSPELVRRGFDAIGRCKDASAEVSP